MNQQTVLNRKEAAAYLKIGISTLKKLDIPTVKIGKRVLYPQASIDTWIVQHIGGTVKTQ